MTGRKQEGADSLPTTVLARPAVPAGERLKVVLAHAVAVGFFSIPVYALGLFVSSEPIGGVLGIGVAAWVAWSAHEMRELTRDATERRVRIDRDTMKFWVERNPIILELKTLAAGRVTQLSGEGGTRTKLKLYSMIGEPPRIVTSSEDLGAYQVVSTDIPAIEAGRAAMLEGNILVLESLRAHLFDRLQQGLPVAAPPGAAVREEVSRGTWHRLLPELRTRTLVCEGGFLTYDDGKDPAQRVPLEAIRAVSERKVALDNTVRQHALTHELTLDLDPSCGHSSLLLDLVAMDDPQGVVDYLECVSSYFFRRAERGAPAPTVS